MLEQPDRLWEVHGGQLREKPAMSEVHNRTIWRLVLELFPQMDVARFELRTNMGRLRQANSTYYVPDLYIVPIIGPDTVRDRPYRLEVFNDPLPLVVEGWSPSTGNYDVREKIPEYQRRGDHEIWEIHPFDLTLTAWHCQPDSSYFQSVHRTGVLPLAAFPDVTIDLDALFA